MPGYDPRGMPESTPCEWSVPQGDYRANVFFFGTECSVSCQSSSVYYVWFSPLCTKKKSDFAHFGVTHWHFNVTDIFIRSHYQPECLYNSSQQSTTRNHRAVFCFISWRKKEVVCIMWSLAVDGSTRTGLYRRKQNSGPNWTNLNPFHGCLVKHCNS